MKITMTKIAKITGYSLSTVSKAFRGSSEISEETKKEIFEIARKHNCFEKFYTPTYKKKVIAIICNELLGSVYGVIVDSINNQITANGDVLLISSCNFITTNLEDLFNYYITYHRVDGLIVLGKLPKSVLSDNKTLNKIPLVNILSAQENSEQFCDIVETDRNNGIRSAIRYLKDCGHTRIGFIGEYLTSGYQKSFIKSMEYFNLEIKNEWIVRSSKRMSDAGIDGMERILSLPFKPTAIFAAYDAIAFGAINHINRSGLSVPKDFSIIGSDNIPLSVHCTPSLTTISEPFDDITEGALNLLYRRMKNQGAPYQRIQIQSQLILRDSVAKISK